MVHTILMCCALLGSLGGGDPQTPAATLGRSCGLPGGQEHRPAAMPDAHVRLALWCESHGLTAERLKHLSLAVLYDPSNMLARGLMGLVALHGNGIVPTPSASRSATIRPTRRSFANTSTAGHGRPTRQRPR